jgi:uncharacterized OB-fold protein
MVASEHELPSAPHTIDEFIQGYEESGKLRGFRCPGCGLITATWGLACSRCGTADLVETELSSRGKVTAFTILHVPGDQFLNEAPYAYVVVELDGGGRVTGWMPSVRTENELTIGERVRFTSSYKPGVQFVKESDPTPSG